MNNKNSAAALQTNAEYELSEAQFQRLRQLVREHTGIALSEAKHDLVFGRLVRRLRALKLDGFGPYITLLERGDARELEEFTNAITTNLTSFFRELHHFEHLAAEVIPEWQRNAQSNGRIRIWSCACSTGEEPYSIAMVLREHQAALSGIDVKILATDLDSSVLATAKAGLYGQDRTKGISPARMSTFFQLDKSHTPPVSKVTTSLAQLITFKQLNLMDGWPMSGPFDVIFCRNVIIYFDKPTQRELFTRIAEMQRPGDVLYLGHSESLNGVSNAYKLIGRTIYRRVEI